MLKQAFDYCRVRETSQTNHHTALWWFNEVDEMRDSLDLQYLHGISMDPIRSAIALRLLTTGRLGEHLLKMNPENKGNFEQYPFSVGTPIIQNNYMRLNMANWQDQKTLVYDISHLAEYDYNHNNKITLSNNLITTIVPLQKNSSGVVGFIDSMSDDFNSLWQENNQQLIINVKQAGWYLATMAECSGKNSGQVSLIVDGKTQDAFSNSSALGESVIHTLSYWLEAGTHKFELLMSDKNDFAIDAFSVSAIDYVGEPNGTNQEFKSAGGFGGIDDVYKFKKGIDNQNMFPGGLASDGKQWPKIMDISFEAEVGMHALQIHLDGNGPLEFFLDNERVLITDIQKGQFPVFFGITKPGKHTFRIMTWGKKANVNFDALGIARIFDRGATQCIEEPVGYWANIIEEIKIPANEGQLNETRNYTMKNDAPWIEMELNRTITGNIDEVFTLMSLPGYTSLHVGKTIYNTSGKLKNIPDIMLLRDDTGVKPDIMLAIPEKGNIEDISFVSGKELRLRSGQNKDEVIKLVLFISDVLYSSKELYKHFQNIIQPHYEEQPLLSEVDKLQVSNKYKIPVMTIVPVAQDNKSPFYVLEESPKDGEKWWLVRGGQSALTKDSTYLRLYLQPKSSATIQSYGFINGIVKGGIGSQHILAINEVITAQSCKVNVFNVTPYVFAPSVVFKEEFSAVKVNGSNWSYYDGNAVYLPNKTGVYSIETFKKEKAPHLLRTQALVNKVEWKENKLIIDVEDPLWFPYGDMPYTIGISKEGYSIKSVSNGGEIISQESMRLKNKDDLQKMTENYEVVKLKTGQTEIVFSK